MERKQKNRFHQGNSKVLHTLIVATLLILLQLSSVYAYNKSHYYRLLTTNSCRNCDLYGAPLSKIDLTGADLTGATLTAATFKKATLYKAKLPDKSDYRYADFTGAMWTNGQICREGSIGKCTCNPNDYPGHGCERE